MSNAAILTHANVYDTYVDNTSFRDGSSLGNIVRIETIALLLSGWSPPRISRHMLQVFEIEIPPVHVAELQATLPEEAFAPPSKLSEQLQVDELEIDALTVAARAIRVTEDRLASYLKMEDEDNVPQDHTTTLTQLLSRQCGEYLTLKMKMGLLPEKAAVIPISIQTEGEKTLAEILRDHAVLGEGLPADSGEAADPILAGEAG